MGNMEELKQEINSIKEMCLPLESAIKAQLAGGIENIDTHEFGEVVDALKDLCKMALVKSQKAYYCSVIKAMEDAEDDGELRDKIMELTSGEDMRFYNSSRYSNGRYATSGRGSRRNHDGYMPMENDYSYYRDGNRIPRMYYSVDMNGDSYSTNGNMSSGTGTNTNNGMNYSNDGMRTYEIANRSTAVDRMQRQESRYDRARRNYTDSRRMHSNNTVEDKQSNIDELESYMRVLGDDITEMIKDASPEEKDVLRQKLGKLQARI